MSYYGHESAGGGGAGPTFHNAGGTAAAGVGQINAAKIFAGGLSWQTTEETLRYHFEQYAEIVSVEVMRDRNTGDPRGFAFVVFKSDETVDLILKNKLHEINHKVVDAKRVQARRVAPLSIHHGGETLNILTFSIHNVGGGHQSSRVKQEDGGGGGPSPEELKNKVFVGSLPLHVDKDGLKDFSCFGPVTDVSASFIMCLYGHSISFRYTIHVFLDLSNDLAGSPHWNRGMYRLSNPFHVFQLCWLVDEEFRAWQNLGTTRKAGRQKQIFPV
ncbi:hypothetical protein ACHAWF_002014 [Thalassiosira exigua]